MKDVLTRKLLRWIELGRVPDNLIRMGSRRLCGDRIRELAEPDCETQQATLDEFIDSMNRDSVAPLAHKANEQHYEVPADFFAMCLGTHRKYSCCYWDDETKTLDGAEAKSLAISCEHADLHDGQSILELGCGWGSLTLWMGEHYPNANILSVSNSNSQREYIMAEAKRRGLYNIEVVTADMNDFDTDRTFDRAVSIEMFEHMRNYKVLLKRVSGWLKPAGKLFVHIFVHKNAPYAFETEGADDFIGKYFFTGGIMPSDELMLHFQDDVKLNHRWRWSGTHYEKTANAWLANMDANRPAIMKLFQEVYGQEEANIWFNRWRVFYIACAELWGYRNGQEWWVSHYQFQNRRRHESLSDANGKAHCEEAQKCESPVAV